MFKTFFLDEFIFFSVILKLLLILLFVFILLFSVLLFILSVNEFFIKEILVLFKKIFDDFILFFKFNKVLLFIYKNYYLFLIFKIIY